MKGRAHFAFTALMGFFIFLPLLHFILDKIGLGHASIIIFAVTSICFIMGSILPDSDSENRGSFIFYTPFALIALILNFLEPFIANFLGMSVGHRQSFHKFRGILITSLIVIILVAIVLISFNVFNFWALLFGYLGLVISQLIHVSQDHIDNMFAYLGIILILSFISLNLSSVYSINIMDEPRSYKDKEETPQEEVIEQKDMAYSVKLTDSFAYWEDESGRTKFVRNMHRAKYYCEEKGGCGTDTHIDTEKRGLYFYCICEKKDDMVEKATIII